MTATRSFSPITVRFTPSVSTYMYTYMSFECRLICANFDFNLLWAKKVVLFVVVVDLYVFLIESLLIKKEKKVFLVECCSWDWTLLLGLVIYSVKT